MIVTIDLINDCKAEAVPATELVQHWAELTIRNLLASGTLTAGSAFFATDKPLTLALRVIDNKTSADLNLTYRQKGYATNVLSFSSALPQVILSTLDEYPLGDLAICAPVVAEEALQQNKNPEHHWAHMIVHGVLHLCGLDHQNEPDALRMEKLETRILAELGIGDPYKIETDAEF
jgi:probable rRNA maturation factor